MKLEEIAYLAALPKGPNNYHPIKKYDAAVTRRNWVISRMLEDGYITKEEAAEAKKQPLTTVERKTGFLKDAEYEKHMAKVRESAAQSISPWSPTQYF